MAGFATVRQPVAGLLKLAFGVMMGEGMSGVGENVGEGVEAI
jgi:hypothetical protein